MLHHIILVAAHAYLQQVNWTCTLSFISISWAPKFKQSNY